MNDLSSTPRPASVVRSHEDDETVYSVLRSVTRLGPWEPPENMRLVSVMGNIVLDYQDAELPLGVTSVECEVFMGSVEIVVPPDVDVELTGSVFLGSVETHAGGERSDRPRSERERLVGPGSELEDEYERPLLSVHCSGAMGSVELKLA